MRSSARRMAQETDERARPREADDAVLGVLQLARMGGHAGARQIAGRSVDAQLQVAHMACRQRQVADLAAPDDAIHVLVDQVHFPVADPQMQQNVRIPRLEAGSAGTRIVLANGLGTSTRSLPPGVADAPDRLVSASSRSASSCRTRS